MFDDSRVPDTHPGRYLSQRLNSISLSVEGLSERTNLPVKTINGILDGKLLPTPEVCLLFAKAFARIDDDESEFDWYSLHVEVKRWTEALLHHLRSPKEDVIYPK